MCQIFHKQQLVHGVIRNLLQKPNPWQKKSTSGTVKHFYYNAFSYVALYTLYLRVTWKCISHYTKKRSRLQKNSSNHNAAIFVFFYNNELSRLNLTMDIIDTETDYGHYKRLKVLNVVHKKRHNKIICLFAATYLSIVSSNSRIACFALSSSWFLRASCTC